MQPYSRFSRSINDLNTTLSGIADDMVSKKIRKYMLNKATSGQPLTIQDLDEVQSAFPRVEPMKVWQEMQNVNKITTADRFKTYANDLMSRLKIAKQNGDKIDEKWVQENMDGVVPSGEQMEFYKAFQPGFQMFMDKNPQYFSNVKNIVSLDAGGNVKEEYTAPTPTEESKGTVVPEGSAYVKDGKVVYKNERPPASTGDTSYAPDMQTWVNDKTGQDMTVNARDQKQVSDAQRMGFSPESSADRGYGMERGKENAKAEGEINTASAQAAQKMVTFTGMEQLLDRFTSGKLANVQKSLMQYADALGVPVDVSKLGGMEAFNAIANQMALESRNLGEGMVLAGQMSDRDVQFLKDMNPQLIISKGGNKLIINMRKKLAERQVDLGRQMRKFKKENGGRFDETAFREYLDQSRNADSIFGIPDGAMATGKTHKETGLPVYELNGKFYIPEF